MTEVSAPMTPADCNLRGLPFMPLEVQRLLDSDLFILSTGDEFKAAVALWCKSWGQIPGGSLPDNDRLLEGLSGAKSWKKVREMALRGWVKCSDGRLYHPVVAENALKAWESREDHRETNEGRNERQKRWRDRIKDLSARLRDAGVTPPMNASMAELERLMHLHVDGYVDADASTKKSTVDNSETANKGKGEGKGKGTKKGAKAPLPADKLPAWMDSLVNLYHEVLPELPGVRVMDKEREQAIRDFWDWVMTTNRPGGEPRATNEQEALDWTRDYFTRARGNDFIMGRGPKSPGHENWRCPIEYLLSAKGMKKVIEETREAA
ncbi:MAG: DUF1376 domain-containing protein [Geobacteraceae bacterium]